MGEIILFITGFSWSFGCENSKKITEYRDYYKSAFSFWGTYHRFNKWILSLTDFESIAQGILAALFFAPLILLLGNLEFFIPLLLGGITYMGLKILIKKITRASH